MLDNATVAKEAVAENELDSADVAIDAVPNNEPLNDPVKEPVALNLVPSYVKVGIPPKTLPLLYCTCVSDPPGSPPPPCIVTPAIFIFI
jgi:hypothetical protein